MVTDGGTDLPIEDTPDVDMVDTNDPDGDKQRKRRIRRIRNPFGPSDAEVRANVAGEASSDAALALQVESEGAVPRDLTAAAFFDVDNTMVQGASIIHFARGLAARKYFTTGDVAQFAWQQVKFRVSGKENSEDVASGREKALSFITGRPTAELSRLGEEIYDEMIADKSGMARGLLDETLVVCMSEFGRSPRLEAKPRTARADCAGVMPKTNRLPPAMVSSFDSDTIGTPRPTASATARDWPENSGPSRHTLITPVSTKTPPITPTTGISAARQRRKTKPSRAARPASVNSR